jgi:hypothetical protein
MLPSQPRAAPCRNLVVHGTESTGKSSITEQLLARLAEHIATEPQSGGFGYAVVNAAQCITSRHLFERIVGSVADALELVMEAAESSSSTPASLPGRQRRCETMAQLSVAMSTMLNDRTRDPRWRFVLVLDAVDRQRDAPPTLLPALARLSEIVILPLSLSLSSYDVCCCCLVLTRAFYRFLASPASSLSPRRLLACCGRPRRRIFTFPHTQKPSSSAF